MLGQGPLREQETSATVDGAEKAGWSLIVREWGSGLRSLSLRATSGGGD